MKNVKKLSVIIITIIFVLMITIVAGCGNSGKIKTDVPVSEISASFSPLISNASKLTVADSDYIDGMLGIDTSILEDYVLMIQTSGTAIDQYGIFKVKNDTDLDKIEAAVSAYLEKLETNWDAFNYLPEEQVKIKSAESYSAGPYIIFTILSEAEKNAVINAFNDMLK